MKADTRHYTHMAIFLGLGEEFHDLLIVIESSRVPM